MRKKFTGPVWRQPAWTGRLRKIPAYSQVICRKNKIGLVRCAVSQSKPFMNHSPVARRFGADVPRFSMGVQEEAMIRCNHRLLKPHPFQFVNGDADSLERVMNQPKGCFRRGFRKAFSGPNKGIKAHFSKPLAESPAQDIHPLIDVCKPHFAEYRDNIAIPVCEAERFSGFGQLRASSRLRILLWVASITRRVSLPISKQRSR